MEDLRKYRLEDIRVAIVDDHELVLEGFSSYMRKHGVGVVEPFLRAEALLECVRKNRFDIYIIDIELPDMDSVALIDELRHLHPEARIVINTMHEEIWVVRRMMTKRVNGMMYKSGSLDQLLEAVDTVMSGRQYFCSKFRHASEQLLLSDITLTHREQEILQAIAKGLSSKEIAGALFISENTVESHRQNLFSKLRARNMAELIMKGISAGYLEVID